jgi:hypothetical protein
MDVIETISSQTNVTDKDLIEKTYKENGDDMVATIMALMNIKDTSRQKREPMYVDEVRDILAEKEQLYKAYCDAQRVNATLG